MDCEKVILKNALIISDTHVCLYEEFDLIRCIAHEFGCNVILHAGDMLDEHLGHPALEEFEVYVCLTHLNRSEQPEDYNYLPANWHVFNQLENNIFRFNYFLFNQIGNLDLQRSVCFEIVHNFGKKYLGNDTLFSRPADINCDPEEGHVYKLITDEQKHVIQKYEWLNWIIFGHTHHIFDFGFHGVKAFNPGAWFEKKCFAIIVPGFLNFHQFSLTENCIMHRPFKEIISFFKSSFTSLSNS